MPDESNTTLVRLDPTSHGVARFDAERIADDLEGASERALRAKSPNTLRAYGVAWAWFEHYCTTHGSTHLPAHPATVAAYLHARAAGQVEEPPARAVRRRNHPRTPIDGPPSLTTVTTALSAIAHYHRQAGLMPPTEHPQVQQVMEGIARDLGRGVEPKTPVRIPDLLQLATMHENDESLAWRRDWAVLLLGFATALRRSNLVALRVEDLTFDPRGLVVAVRRSKTDQEGIGREVGVLRRPKICPVRAVEAWLSASGVTAGPLFRSLTRWGTLRGGGMPDATVDVLVKHHMASLGFQAAGYGAHSLRAGFATEAKDKALRDVMDQGGWTEPKTALRYMRKGSIFDNNPTDILP